MDKSFRYDRNIHFRDTDAAGVVYFANGLAICHEAYENSLAVAGIRLQDFFRGMAIAVPITHANIDFFKPMFCGDRITVILQPTLTSANSFQIAYQLYFTADVDLNLDGNKGQLEKAMIAKALTKHTCIDPKTRKRCDFSEELLKWIELTK
jgi:1,4-dihydroxy-2-naphthoyl-CoA hydrolase